MKKSRYSGVTLWLINAMERTGKATRSRILAEIRLQHPTMRSCCGAESAFSVGIKDLQENGDVFITEGNMANPNLYNLD